MKALSTLAGLPAVTSALVVVEEKVQRREGSAREALSRRLRRPVAGAGDSRFRTLAQVPAAGGC